MCQKIISHNQPRMIESKIKHLLNDVIGTHTCTVNNTIFTYINPNYLDTKKTRKSITYNYMLYKGVVVSKINNHYSIIYLGLTN